MRLHRSYGRENRCAGGAVGSIVDFIDEINSMMAPMSMKILSIVSDDDDKLYYGLVNTLADDVSKLATAYKEKELIYFRKLVPMRRASRCI
jgi:hypothetical protein